jgi:hypothetical protein
VEPYGVSQGYTSLRITLNPPLTPPYFSVAFATIQCVVPLIQLSLDVVHGGGGPSNAVLSNITRIVVPAIFLWIAGTLPLQPVAASTNIAGPKDVGLFHCLFLLINKCQIPSVAMSCPEDNVTVCLIPSCRTKL